MYSVYTLVPVKYSISPSFFVRYQSLPTTVTCSSTNSVRASSSSSEGTFRNEMYVYFSCLHGFFWKSGIKVLEKLYWIVNGSVQKVFTSWEVSNWIGMYLMLDEICITSICRSRFLLCSAWPMSCLLIGGLLLSIHSFWMPYILLVQLLLPRTTFVHGLYDCMKLMPLLSMLVVSLVLPIDITNDI